MPRRVRRADRVRLFSYGGANIGSMSCCRYR
jgi:hypothetical protein